MPFDLLLSSRHAINRQPAPIRQRNRDRIGDVGRRGRLGEPALALDGALDLFF
jgi:hypothetical protein